MPAKRVVIGQRLARGFEAAIADAEALRDTVVLEELGSLEALIATLKMSQAIAMTGCPKQQWYRTFKVQPGAPKAKSRRRGKR